MQPCGNAYAVSVKLDFPIEVSGKILDRDGNPFTDSVGIELSVQVASLGFDVPDHSEFKTYNIQVQGGTFSWKGEGSSVTIEAVKEGYHSTRVDIYDTAPMSEEEKRIIDEARSKGEGCRPKFLKKLCIASPSRTAISLSILFPRHPFYTPVYRACLYPGKKDEKSGVNGAVGLLPRMVFILLTGMFP
jgi:hypothetical protein